MFGFIKALTQRKAPARPLYALLLQQQATGTAVQAIGPDVPLVDAKRMLLEALTMIEEQELAALQAQRKARLP